MRYKLLYILFFIILFFISFYHTTKPEISAQNPVTGYIICSTGMNCATNPPNCQPGYRVPDECLADPNQCCITSPYGHCEINGACYCQQFIDCVPNTQPTPTAAPNCPVDWECLITDQNSCLFYNGAWTPCYIGPGQNGTCCKPPDQGNSCTNEGGYCRTPAEQSNPGNCEWNEVLLHISCENWGFPQGTLCCKASYISSCSLEIGGVCRNTCEIGEFPYNGFSDCTNPSLYPPNGSICCIKTSNDYCTGWNSNLSGDCHFVNCPPNRPWDGINIPTWIPIPTTYPTSWPRPGFYSQCAYFESCCLFATPTIIPRPELRVDCSVNGQKGINTAIGCIPVDTQTNLLKFILPWAIGVAGGTSFILMIVAGFLIMTSSGNPQRTKAGKELLTAAIAGLLMIIFSVYLLNLIGVRILRIPGL